MTAPSNLAARVGSLCAVVFALGMISLLWFGGKAKASYDPVGGGSIEWVLSKPFVDLLARHDVQIKVKAGAEHRGRSIVLPAVAGRIESGLGRGTVEAGGTVIFASGGKKLPFRSFIFEGKRAPLYAKVGGGKLKIATGARLEARRWGFGAAFESRGLRLTPKAASRLDKKLRLHRELQAGIPLGTIKTFAQPATVHLREGPGARLALDPSFVAKLDQLFVSVNPVAPAELGPGPTLSFPVGPESTLAPDAASGTIKLGGQVELLQLGSAQMFLRELWLQPAEPALLAETETIPSPPHAGKQPQAPLLALQPGGTIASDPRSRTISVGGQPVALTPATAAALNDAFASSQGKGDVFAAGETVGALSLSVRGA